MYIHSVVCCSLIGALPVAALAAPCPGGGENARAVVAVKARSYTALTEGWIEASPYRVGQLVGAGQPVVRLSHPAQQAQITALLGRITELELRKLDLANIGMLNRASLDQYEQEHGPLTDQARRRIVRADERELLERNLGELRQQVQRLQRQGAHTVGRFPYPIVLLASPAREGETVQAGGALFEYSPLDELQLAVFPPPGRAPAAQVQLTMGQECLKLSLVRAQLDPKNGTTQWTYQGRVAPVLAPDMARLLLRPAPWLNVQLAGDRP